jgi:hypothetical protein
VVGISAFLGSAVSVLSNLPALACPWGNGTHLGSFLSLGPLAPATIALPPDATIRTLLGAVHEREERERRTPPGTYQVWLHGSQFPLGQDVALAPLDFQGHATFFLIPVGFAPAWTQGSVSLTRFK